MLLYLQIVFLSENQFNLTYTGNTVIFYLFFTPHAQCEWGNVIGDDVHIYILYIYIMFVDQIVLIRLFKHSR